MSGAGLRAELTAARGDHTVRVRLSVAPGSTLAVLGPNGAGKTTLLRALAGLSRPTAGAVHLDGTVLDDAERAAHVPPERRSVGVVFQDLRLFERMDVTDNVAFGLRAAGLRRTEARARAHEWLGRVGLDHVAGTPVRALSGGEAQRVALARTLATMPRLLLLDEPLAALDASVRLAVRRTLREHLASHDGPCVLVTHDPLDAAVLADRVMILEDGLVTDEGRLHDLVVRPRSPWAAELAGTNLLAARADGRRLRLSTGGVLQTADEAGSGSVLVAIRPSSVTLHRSRPEGSARNVWEATVADLEGLAERVRVGLAGEIPLVAEVTRAAASELALAGGVQVWASVKATDVVAYPT